LERKGNTTICCISLVFDRSSSGTINGITLNATKLHTDCLTTLSPRDFTVKTKNASTTLSFNIDLSVCLLEEKLGHARFLLHSFLEPLCIGVIGRNDFTILQHHEHIKLEQRPARESLVFVLPNKQATLRDLRLLGCDLEKQYVPG
jgi:hypothetical protein